MSFYGTSAESERRSGTASGSQSVERINAVCRLAAEGKLAARRITVWLGRSEINEPEFRLLWLLAGTASAGISAVPLDQADLAEQLVVSPAQVSGAVERLRSLGLVERLQHQRDRRRQLWRVTDAGDALLGRIVDRVANQAPGDALRIPPLAPPFEGGESMQEAAA
jgi:DNA-binding MarR family transcriptional regulator